eukprot:NODE_6_length_3702_cov_222.500684_g4_i0.p1 GENE.NODE_6_length_3702_cov_222.500684_g4_i0~~NODE_6_length_3702_cov_222.500684_g4_i0.p1  ORF type:complete len:529 (+),score=84.15 NODE_6_length_3702_cov_222.500684_g4_i0:94-1680(+)
MASSTLSLQPGDPPLEIEALCMRCFQSGNTRLMILRIPHFREVIVSSFECPNEDCLEKNTEIQFGGKFAEKGVHIEVKVVDQRDLDRQVAKSEYCTISIPELELEIPPESQKGALSTIEGILSRTAEGLGQEQPVRKLMDPELAEKIDNFIAKLEQFSTGTEKFTIVLDDPSGNSHIQNFLAPVLDPQMTTRNYFRSVEQCEMLGILPDGACVSAAADAIMSLPDKQHPDTKRTEAEQHAVDEGELKEVYEIETPCVACRHPGLVKTVSVEIPHFGETVIMCFTCEACGYRSTEVKPGGGIPPKGTRIAFRYANEKDLSRSVLKSHHATLVIPELDFEVPEATLGSMFTTVEGLLQQIHEQLKGLNFASFTIGDSSPGDDKERWSTFLQGLDEMRQGLRPFTLLIDDPLSASYIQNPFAPEEDPCLKIELYDRTAEQDEDLGITALKKMDERLMDDSCLAPELAAARSVDMPADPPPATSTSDSMSSGPASSAGPGLQGSLGCNSSKNEVIHQEACTRTDTDVHRMAV